MTTTRSCPVDWTGVAPGWDRNRRHVETMKAKLTRQLLDGLQLANGDRVLELGAGTGELARELCTAVAPDGQVIASDAAAGMVELIRATLAGVPHARVEQLNASAIELPDGSVDVVVFRMGLMLVDEPAGALAEIRRVLAADGRLGVAVWAGPEHNPWLTSVGMAAMMHGLVAGPPVGAGTPFSLSDPGRLAALVGAAGFTDVEVRAVDTLVRFESVADYVDTTSSLAPPLGAALGSAPPEAFAAVRQTVGDLTSRFRDGERLAMPGRGLLCLAR
jgi:ubiquinone/menaquinone biosynthesis C-methylase UbiE